MPRAAAPTLSPRKTPLQARSNVTVDAILQAAIQVLVAVGKEKLTTTLVAQRAGVSVGTLYQYFPNKSSLLQAALKRHMAAVSGTIDEASRTLRGHSIFEMASTLAIAYLKAKMYNVKESVALYAVSSDIDGMTIAKQAGQRGIQKLTELFATAPEPLTKDPQLIATVVLSTFNGISRRLLESKSPERELAPLREELLALVDAYLHTCIAT